jgi:hypothetical protein
MPTCLRARQEASREIHDREWREPPGYLGEAVRRAKLIPAQPRYLHTIHIQDGLPAKP